MQIEDYFIKAISKTKAEFEPFIDLAIEDEDFRNIVISHQMNNKSINVYYHSYLVLERATKANPELFYNHWNTFAKLLKYENSYHRNYGMNLISNLIEVDKDNLFELIFDNYYKQLDDEKISTRKYCISNSIKIINSKPELVIRILSTIINSLRINSSTEKHQNFLISEFLTLLAEIKIEYEATKIVLDFLTDVIAKTNSNKIKREAKKIVDKFYT